MADGNAINPDNGNGNGAWAGPLAFVLLIGSGLQVAQVGVSMKQGKQIRANAARMEQLEKDLAAIKAQRQERDGKR